MKRVKCVKENGELVFEKIFKASFIFDRMKGLMFQKRITYGVLFERCNTIQTFFMRAPIDVVYLDSNDSIVKIYHCLKPWRITPIDWKTRSVLELPCGVAKEKKLETGDRIKIECIN